MPDDPVQPASEQEQPTQKPQSTNIEALQEQIAHEGRQATTEQALRQLLSVLDPHPNDHALDYKGVLGRLENVIARELHAQGG